MKAPSFSYERPESVADALDLLAAPDIKPLAGGQSLVPMMAMRLARPQTLVDLNRLGELCNLDRTDQSLEVGAMCRQRELELRPGLQEEVPLLAGALPFVGHREIRNRGTIGGSIAHADPAAELCLVAATLDATLTLHSTTGKRSVSADGFCTGSFQTQLQSGELVGSVRFPLAVAGDGFSFAEIARRHGDFALCGVACHIRRRPAQIDLARVGLMGVAQAPVVYELTAELGEAFDNALDFKRLGALVSDWIDPPSDMHASSGYRRRLARVLVARCVAAAWQDAESRV
jgi:2-furoyl-CoA dehydrogenase FAD binding subunit